ncbi:MAG: hypothetical protein IPI44_05450 [Sulfuritalea sp.]|nr:hypothetical protein [Sulfuritalea sp.]
MKLGTGHGEREYSPTRHTEFVRNSDSPDEIVTIYYDTRQSSPVASFRRRALPSHRRFRAAAASCRIREVSEWTGTSLKPPFGLSLSKP